MTRQRKKRAHTHLPCSAPPSVRDDKTRQRRPRRRPPSVHPPINPPRRPIVAGSAAPAKTSLLLLLLSLTVTPASRAWIPPNGLPPASRAWIQHQKELVNQVLKAAMAINANFLMEMAIPESYLETLPENLGDALYRNITDVEFDTHEFLSNVDLTSEYKICGLKDRIEASVIIWNRKVHNKDGKSAWGSAVSQEKREQFEERAASSPSSVAGFLEQQKAMA